MKVKIVYRNYKPLHKIYESLVKNPPNGVEYVIPPVKQQYKKLYKFYKKMRYIGFVKRLIYFFEKTIFTTRPDDKDIDIYHYINMIDQNPPSKPYMVDIEYAASLISFVPNDKRLKNVISFLQNDQCKAINCLSFAAKRSLQRLLGNIYESIEGKVHVVYPALEEIQEHTADFSKIHRDVSKLKILFVGNQAYLKGLEELLRATQRLSKKYGSEILQLHIISDDAGYLVKRYPGNNILLYPPLFSKQEIIEKFFMPADVFVMPTKEDTFGMALLDSLSSGTPVIASKQFAIPEIVTEGIDGLLINLQPPLLDSVAVPTKKQMEGVTKSNLDPVLETSLYDSLELCIEDRLDLPQMGNNGFRKFQDGGQFSIHKRNHELLKIYKSALVEH